MGAAIAAPTALSLVATNFPEGQARNRALGVYAAMSGGGGAVGLLLGGILTEWVSWRWIFFVNVPIAATVLFLAPRALNESNTIAGHLDVPGAVTATAGMMSLVYGLSNPAVHGWTSPITLGPIALAPVLLLAFGLIEARTAKPLMPLRIFANRNRSGAYLMMVCAATSAFSMLFFLTQFMQNVLGWSPVKTGVGFVPFTAGIVLAAAVTSRVLGRVTVRIPLLVGPSAVFIGLGWMSRLTVTSGYFNILWPLVIMALGMGMQFVALTLTAVARRRAERDRSGLRSAQHRPATGRRPGSVGTGHRGHRCNHDQSPVAQRHCRRARLRADPPHCHRHRLHHRVRSRRRYRAGGPGDLGRRYPSPSTTGAVRNYPRRWHSGRPGRVAVILVRPRAAFTLPSPR